MLNKIYQYAYVVHACVLQIYHVTKQIDMLACIALMHALNDEYDVKVHCLIAFNT